MRHYEIAATTPNQPMSDWCQLMALCKYPHVLRRPVAVTVTCNGAKHLFSVNRDWSVSSEHNLEQDRLLAVLGGEEHQCLKLEMYVGRLRELAEFHARRRKYPIRFIEPGVWEADLGTYNRRRFMSVLLAGEFIRTECAPPGYSTDGSFQLRPAVIAVSSIQRVPRLWARAVASLFVESNVADILWRSGIHPRVAAEDLSRFVGPEASLISVFDYVEQYYSSGSCVRGDSIDHGAQEYSSNLRDESINEVVVPRLVEELLSDSRAMAAIAKRSLLPTPRHDHGSTVPGCTVFPVFDQPLTSDMISQEAVANATGRSSTVEGILKVRRSEVRGTSVVVVEHLDGSRLPTVVPYSGVDKVSINAPDRSNLIAELARELVSGGLHPEMNVSGVPYLVTGGEYVLALIAILGGVKGRAISDIREDMLATLYILVLRGHFPDVYSKVILRMVTSIWVEEFPGTWGMRAKVWSHDLVVFDVTRSELPVDIEKLRSSVDQLVAELCDQLSRNIDGHGLTDGIVVYVRAQYLMCDWDDARVILRPGRWSDPDDAWELVTQGDVRSKVLGILMLRAFFEVTGRRPLTIGLPSGFFTADDRAQVMRELFDLEELSLAIRIVDGRNI